MADVLVVYYSRTGTTRRVATELAAIGGWDVEPLIDMKPRDGLIGYGRSLLDSILGRTTQLAAPRHNPADYDLVVVGTPVWSASISTPIRTWLEEHVGHLRRSPSSLPRIGVVPSASSVRWRRSPA